MKRKLLFAIAVILVFTTTFTLANPTTESFAISFSGSGDISTGSGTGYNDGTGANGTPWYYYENTDWYTQWFYDDPPNSDRYKVITYDITVDAEYLNNIAIAINWTALGYNSGPDGPPPLPPLHPSVEDYLINREVIFEESDISGIHNITGTLIIEDYNPEWVSIDVDFFGGHTSPSVSGTLIHECIPAPGAIILGCIGVSCIARLRRSRNI